MNNHFDYKKINKSYVLTKNAKVIKFSKLEIFKFSSKKSADSIVERLNNVKNELINNQMIQNICFSENLNKNKTPIIDEIIKYLHFDEILYRSGDEKIDRLLNRKYGKYIHDFENYFNIKLQVSSKLIFHQNKLSITKFKQFLQSLNNDKLTVYFKITKNDSSPILSFFFVQRIIDDKMLFKLANLEIIYNLRKRRISDDLEKIIQEKKKNLRNISIFFNL